MQLLPYLRSAGAEVSVALQRAERLTRNIPSAWFAAGASKSAEPLHAFLQGLARHAESEKAALPARSSRSPCSSH